MLEELPSPLLATDRRVVLVRPLNPSRSQSHSLTEGGERTERATVSAARMLLVVWMSLLLALVVGSPGVVHVAEGMPDGISRTVLLDVGQSVQQRADPLHLTQPWYRLQAALGHPESTVQPLLSMPSSPPSTPSPAPPRHPRRRILPMVAPVQVHKPHPQLHKPHPQVHKLHHEIRQIRVHRPVPQRRVQVPPPLRTVSRRNPLRLLITGDSLPGYLGPQLLSNLARIGPIVGWTDVHDGTGLTRPDFVDWSVVARQQVAQYHPDAVVVLLGGNDFQNMVVGNKVLIAGTPAWRQEYQRRALICMRIWAQGGVAHRVYWLSMPPARDPGWAYDDAQINLALQAAARQLPGARYVDILGPITNRGAYTDVVNVGGQPTLIREADGVHLNIAGSDVVAGELTPIIAKEWKLGGRVGR